jgi:zinc protease
MGSTYSVDVDANPSHYPQQEYRFSITFGGSPDRMEAIIAAALAEIERSRQTPPSAQEVDKIKEVIRREREIDLRSNSYWLSVLQFYAFHKEDPLQILDFNILIDNLSPVELQQAVTTYLNPDQYVQVVLYPEKQGEKREEERLKAED